jgi:hypothetical protein
MFHVKQYAVHSLLLGEAMFHVKHYSVHCFEFWLCALRELKDLLGNTPPKQRIVSRETIRCPLPFVSANALIQMKDLLGTP